MPFDKLDKKAQEAAENFRPEYNEEAWAKMEALLDEHMPVGAGQERVAEKKHPEKWLLLLLFLAAGFLLIVFLIPNKSDKDKINNAAIETKSTPASVPEKPASTTNGTANAGTGNDQKNEEAQENVTISERKDNEVERGTEENSTADIAQKNITPGNQTVPAQARNRAFTASQINNRDGSAPGAVDESETKYLLMGQPTQLINDRLNNGPIQREKITAGSLSPLTRAEVNDNFLVKNSKQTTLAKRTFANSFSLTFSAGPDVSAVGVDNIGSTEFLLGAGIGYNIGQRWMIRTGFYTVAKVYSASPSDYHPPANFWNYYPDLEDIAANCRVNAIPLIVSYSFDQNAKRAWFASAGLSSYFMKRETYNYISKTPGGQYQEKSYTIRNQNTHYFSSLRLSAGYQKNISRKVSFTTEPYINLPVTGIGYGKVKLSSAGILFSLSVKPFMKK